MKKILVIDESPLFRNYLKERLEKYNFEVMLSISGFDGSIKIRNEMPDLIIMDYYLSRKSSVEVLQEKKQNPNTSGIPVIMASSQIDKDKIREIAVYNVRKFFSKPIKFDALIKTISELLGVELEIDTTPCIIEAHFNDEILFIEVARGLNKEKIELLKYKITELLDLYEIQVPKVLVMISDMQVGRGDASKLEALFNTILTNGKTKPKFVQVLTNSEYIYEFINGHKDLNGIGVTKSLEKAMDRLLGKKAEEYLEGDRKVVQQEFLAAAAPKKDKDESILMRFDGETVKDVPFDLQKLGKDVRLCIVDDDMVIQELIKTAFSDTEWDIATYNNGKEFIESGKTFDLVFLDLMMPEMNGFQVLQYLKEKNIALPIIVLSALSKKETVMKAISMGVKSYLIKPLKPQEIVKKTTEILKTNF